MTQKHGEVDRFGSGNMNEAKYLENHELVQKMHRHMICLFFEGEENELEIIKFGSLVRELYANQESLYIGGHFPIWRLKYHVPDHVTNFFSHSYRSVIRIKS